jgi:hypothetical protein
VGSIRPTDQHTKMMLFRMVKIERLQRCGGCLKAGEERRVGIPGNKTDPSMNFRGN